MNIRYVITIPGRTFVWQTQPRQLLPLVNAGITLARRSGGNPGTQRIAENTLAVYI